jgi:hypothetical protein
LPENGSLEQRFFFCDTLILQRLIVQGQNYGEEGKTRQSCQQRYYKFYPIERIDSKKSAKKHTPYLSIRELK